MRSRRAMAAEKVQLVRQGNKVTVELEETGEVLAYCQIGDDLHVELIADSLSAKRLPNAAMKLRQMAMDARKPRFTTHNANTGT